VEGAADAIEAFLLRLPKEVPPLAHITSIAVTDRPSNHDIDFRHPAKPKRRHAPGFDLSRCGHL